MIKIFLVEDEVVVRNGIKNSIDWKEAGMDFVGEASDGEVAFPLIKNTKPDILITDIRMPFMDGLELSRLVRKYLPDTKIIILSGYNDFDYAREAINIGITDYLLKPITAASLLETLRKVAAQIKEEEEQRTYLKEFEADKRKHAQLAMQNFFYQIVGGKVPAAVLLEQAVKFDMDLSAGCYNILLFHMFLNTNEIGLYSERENRMWDSLLDGIREMENHILIFTLENDVVAFILKGDDREDLSDVVGKTVSHIQSQIENAQKIYGEPWSYFGGVGTPVARLSQMKTCFEDAGGMFALRYLKTGNHIFFADDAVERENGSHSEPTINLETINIEQLDREIFLGFFRSGLKSEVSMFVKDFFESLGEKNMESMMFRQYVLMQIYFSAVDVMEKMGYAAKELVDACGDINAMSLMTSSKQAYTEYAQNIISAVLDFRDQANRKIEGKTMQDAATFIREHYNEESMCLNMVASYVNLSPNHFSAIFSQQMKRTFIEYLTGVRMEKARELLKTTDLRSAEIAYEVGYRDPHYFSYLFKKTHGVSPRTFRQKSKEV